MKSIILLFLFSFTFSFASGQQISRSVLTTCGGTIATSKGGSISWTMGELFSPTLQKKFHVTTGFQQGVIQIENPVTLREEELKDTSPKQNTISCLAFPNPMAKQLSLRVKGLKEDATLNIITTSGRTILSQNIIQSSTQREIKVTGIESLISGIYYLQIITREQIIHTQKLIKI